MNLFSAAGKILSLFALLLIVLVGFAGITPEESKKVVNLTWLQQHRAAAASTVLLNNQAALIPLKDLRGQIASVNLGTKFGHEFDSLANKYAQVSRFSGPALPSETEVNQLLDALKLYETVLLQVPAAALQNPIVQSLIQGLELDKQVVLAVNGGFPFLAQAESVSTAMVWWEKETAVAANYAAQVIFGGVGATGKLNQTYSARYKKGDGFTTAPTRLTYSLPEALGINSSELQHSIDSIVEEAIQEHATPGAVVMVVKDGNVIFNKAYGAHSYDKARPTRIDDIFDLASLTKVSATTLAVMDLYDQKKVDINSPISDYIPTTQESNKAGLKIKDILLHQAGLPAGVGLPTQASDLSKTGSQDFPLRAADSLFIRKDYFNEVVWPRMLSAKVSTPGKYVYSDLTMYFMKEVVERQTQEPLDQYVLHKFYAPLGMQTAGYLPLTRFPKSRIVPTENDTYFRKSLLQGYVHDGGAAKLGGVAGHAGLFSTANDLAILYQMLLNGGSYGGVQYLNPATVELFTSRQSTVSRRGLGFDGYDAESALGYPSRLASSTTYGHTGYTGTCIWVDPKHKLVYIFLSNRVHPSVSNKLISMRVRAKVQDAVYKAIEKRTVVTAAVQP